MRLLAGVATVLAGTAILGYQSAPFAANAHAAVDLSPTATPMAGNGNPASKAGATYSNGYRLQLDDGGRIVERTPLLGGALHLGGMWPDDYGSVTLPRAVINHYGLGKHRDWRVADRAIYRIDPETHVITAFAALLTGDTFRVGQRVPDGYDVYNIPVAYRDRWRDDSDALYRYAEGRVYRINPGTLIVAEAIDIPAIPEL